MTGQNFRNDSASYILGVQADLKLAKGETYI